MAGIAAAIKWTATKLSSLLPSATPTSSSSTPSGAPNPVLENLKKLERTMKRIQSVLIEAHDRDVSDHSEKLRLEELKELAYDAEDVVGDYEHDVLHAKSESRDRMLELVGGSGQKRKRQEEVIDLDCISVSGPVSEEISRKAKEIRERFEEVTGEWETLRLRESDAPRRTNCSTLARPPTSSLVQESNNIYGRDEDKENIIKQLLSNSKDGSTNDGNGTVKVVSIVGMGGLGKTTLAQLVYNDHRVSEHFELKGWVCVSEGFDVVTLTKIIISCFTQGSCELSELDSLQRYLKSEVRGKRFLLVLDDVWNENPDLWDSLKVPFTSARSGAVLVTARSSAVAHTMQTKPHILSQLGFDDCWSLFKQLVFAREDRDVDEQRIQIAKQIVDRCCGLPLAVKTIGGALCWKYDIESWIAISESRELGSNARNADFLSVLKLSYDHMPPHLKECFATFALFPKDYYFLEDRIIKLWMSMGLIHSDSEKTLEEAGRVYINELQERSMIELDTQSSENQIQRGFVIHGLLHELAQRLAGDEFLIMELNTKFDMFDDQTVRSIPYESFEDIVNSQNLKMFDARREIPSQLSTKIRYLSYLTPQTLEKLKIFPGTTNLRVVLFLDPMCKLAICNAFDKLRYLRALDLSNSGISMLPESIGLLKQLRHLNLSQSGLKVLPDSICNLYNLEILELIKCAIVELPKAIGKLTNLRHLNYSLQYLSCLPIGIVLLTNLKTLSAFIVGNDDSKCSIDELKYLAHLTELHIVRLGNATNKANSGGHLLRKQSLRELTLDWTSDDCVHIKNLEGTSMRQFDENVLRRLEPNRNLEQLTINMYAGSNFPRWISDNSFNKLVEVQINYFLCEFLPPLGQLPALKLLTCNGGKNVCQVGREFFSDHAKTEGFKSLEKLEFYGMDKWKGWSGVNDSDFAKLRFLLICSCPELVVLPCPLSSTLSSMKIAFCERLSIIPPLPSLTHLYLAGTIDENVLVNSQLTQLKSLELSSVDNMLHLDVNSRRFPLLEVLTIQGCKYLHSLVQLSSLTTLKELSIRKCPRLCINAQEQFPPSLKSYEISECDNIVYMSNEERFDQ